MYTKFNPSGVVKRKITPQLLPASLLNCLIRINGLKDISL